LVQPGGFIDLFRLEDEEEEEGEEGRKGEEEEGEIKRGKRKRRRRKRRRRRRSATAFVFLGAAFVVAWRLDTTGAEPIFKRCGVSIIGNNC
tara:strand:- start:301 stop:573 length:273 start_codon:yes stop_codon:yes gene_type:complete